MVAKLEGKMNGSAITFVRVDGDGWEATVPPSLNGAYALELTAYDDAGNVTSCAKYIVIIDWGALTIRLEKNSYYAEIVDCEYRRRFYLSDYFVEVIKCKYGGT